MTSSLQFDFVLFDAGGTLIGTNTDSEFWYEQFFVDACAEQGCAVNVAQVHDVLRRAMRSRRFDSRASSDKEARAFWHHIYTTAFADLLGAKAQNRTPAVIEHLAAEYIDRFESGEFIRVFKDTRPALDSLKQMNIPMGVVSNFSTYLLSFLEKLELTQYFDFVLVSAAEGCEKPDRKIFDRATARCGKPCERLLFVGDSPAEDCIPAAACGMVPILVDRYNRHKAEHSAMTRIQSLTQVPEIVQDGICKATA